MAKKYNKQFKDCACGCGRKVRIFSSKPRKFYSTKCYNSYKSMIIAIFEHQKHVLQSLVGKKSLENALQATISSQAT